MKSVNATFLFFYPEAKRIGEAVETSEGAFHLDGESMILEIPTDGDTPYRIVGRRQEWGGYKGTHDDPSSEGGGAAARWSSLGDRWVGWWEDEGYEYAFSFVESGSQSVS